MGYPETKPWFPGLTLSRGEIKHAILECVTERGAGKSICPSEAARRLDPEDWRRLMKPVRNVAKALAAEGHIEIMRKGKPVDPAGVKGVIRLALPNRAQ